MFEKVRKTLLTICLCGAFVLAVRSEAEASVPYIEDAGVETRSSYLIKVDAPAAYLYQEARQGAARAGRLERGKTYPVLSCEDGWALVETEQGQAYARISDCGTLLETTRETVNEDEALRARVLEYALQFVGNRYVYGGSDPHVGADCSGFTSYVMRHAAGVSLTHSSAAQAGEGRAVSEPKPGDLVFYSSGGRINHVAIYLGNGQIVHASTEKTGIKISNWTYRTPAKIVDVLS